MPDALATHISEPLAQALFLGGRATLAAQRVYREGPISVLSPTMSHNIINSTDADFLDYKDKCSRKLTDHAGENVDEQGRVFGTGIRSNFYGMRHIGGYGMNPPTWPLTDNRQLRADKGLSDKVLEDWHGNIFRAVVRLFFSDLEPVPLKIREGSSSCIPFFANEMHAKKTLARNALADAKKAGELFMKGDYKTAFTKYFFGGAYYVVYRDQASDAVTLEKDGNWTSKPRPVYDFEYAISGGSRGTEFVADKKFDSMDFHVPKGMFRQRRRTAMGGPWAINASLMPIAQAVRKKIYATYAYSFHHTTRESQQTDLRELEAVIAADVSSHDVLWPSSWFLPLVANELRAMGYAEWWVAIYETKGRLPVYVSALAEGQGSTLLGDWTKPDLNAGLHSGNAFTDLEGTMLMCATYLIAQMEHVDGSAINRCSTLSGAIDHVHTYLQGKQEIVQKSKSDDALLGIRTTRLRLKHDQFMAKMVAGEAVSPYMVLGYERGGAFLGNILYYGPDKKMSSLLLIGNMNSWATNQWSPEYGVKPFEKDKSKLKRPFPGLAWGSQFQVYGSAPSYGELKEISERVWYDTMGYSYSAYRDEMLREDERALAKYTATLGSKMDFANRTAIEDEVLASPDKLQYKYVDTDVRDSISDIVFNGLPLEDVEPFFRSVVP